MINIIIALAGTAYGSYTDLKTGYLPDWLSHSMIILGFFLTLFNYSFDKLIWIWATAAIVFAVGYLLYIFGQMGGGDVKLFTALALLIPFYGHEIYPFILPVCILSGLFLMLVMPLQYARRIWEKRKKIKDFRNKAGQVLIFECILLAFGIYWFFKFQFLAILVVPMMISVLILPFKKDIVKLFFAQKKSINKLDEEDVIALELIDKKLKDKLKLWRKTLTNSEIKKLKALAKKYKIKTITVCENLPKFVPYIFASLILNLIYGDFFMLLWDNIF